MSLVNIMFIEDEQRNNHRQQSYYQFTPDVTANDRHALLEGCAVRAMRKKLELVSTVTILVEKNANDAKVAPMVRSGGVCVWSLESGVMLSVLCWCVWLQSP
jgi:hypothetical protein